MSDMENSNQPKTSKGSRRGGTPPEEHRFKPKVSGNPKGRPKGSKNKKKATELDLSELILQGAAATHEFRQGDKVVTMTLAKAVYDSISAKAVKGNHGAQKLFMELLASASAKKLKGEADYLADAITYKNGAQLELERRRQTGEKGPELIPHPDDMVIDPHTGEVSLKGPGTRECKEFLEFLLDREQVFAEEAEEYERLAAEESNAEDRRALEEASENSRKRSLEFTEQITELWPDAYLVVEHDKAKYGEEVVRRLRILGLGRPTREFRGLASALRRTRGKPASH